MFKKFGSALALFILAALVVVTPLTAYGDEPTTEANIGVVKEVPGARYGAPYHVAFPHPIVIEKPAANVPEVCTRWLGVWAGGRWERTRPTALIVHSVSFLADGGWCRARVTYGSGVSSSRSSGVRRRNRAFMIQDLSAIVYGDELAIKRKLGRGQWGYSYKIAPDGKSILGTSYSALTTKNPSVEASLRRMRSPYGPSTPGMVWTRVYN